MGGKQRVRPAGRGQSRFIVSLLVGSLVVTTLLAWQAFQAVESHRATAEGVLRDYAGLAADEFVRRTANEVGYYGYFPLVQALGRWAQSHDPLPEAEQLATVLDENARPALDLLRRTFRIRGETLELSEEDPELAAWVRQSIAEAGLPARGLAVLHGRIDDRLVSVVYAALPGGNGVVGFEVDRSGLEERFRKSFERARLLPESLAAGESASGWIQVVAYEVDGTEIFRSGPSYLSPLRAERPFGDTYSGVLDGSRVVAAIAPQAAEHLVIGGLPYTRLPLLGLLGALSLGLLVAAIFQLRRERALTALRSEFVSRVSHELRTPLTQIRMFTETLLLERVRDDDERRRALVIVDREARRLTHLVENILVFARGERGAIRLTRRRHALDRLVRELVEEFEPLAPDTRLDVVTSPDDAAAEVDEDALRQVLLNLLDNAVKYGPPGQRIAIEVLPERDVVQIRVEDEGPGVPPREREAVWKRFHRLDRDGVPAAAGTGIGLAVVRELIQLHGGKTWVEAGTRGGARFVVELPRAHEAA